MLHQQVRGLAERMADKPGKKKLKKLSNVGTTTRRKEILVWKTEQEIFEATKLVIETQHGAKGVRSRSDCETKPNWSSVNCVYDFFHRRTINKCSQKVGFYIRKSFDTKLSRHDTKIKQ